MQNNIGKIMTYQKALNRFLMLIALVVISIPQIVIAQPALPTPVDADSLDALDGYSFIIGSDLGRNAYYQQKPTAEMMGEVADITGSEFIAALGDIHHYMGVQSVNDPLWMTNYELVYSHPELQIPWYPTLGNHEYKGNTQAVIDYSKISRRWQMPSRYYAKEIEVSDSVTALLLFIDTPSLIDKYRTDREEYPDAAKVDMQKQLNWIEKTLKNSKAKWKIVMGHHPIYCGTTKTEEEQLDLQKRLQPILDKYKVDMTFCGHIHNFQHLNIKGSDIDYMVNSSGSQSREVEPRVGQIFTNPEVGFSICTLEDDQIKVTFVNQDGKIVYQYSRKK